MKKPSFSMTEQMLDEIQERRKKGSNRSEYVREAVQARFNAEDDGVWETPEMDDPEQKATADG